MLFLALALEGGLWRWIHEQVSEEGDPPVVIRAFVSLLQSFAVLILIAGTLGEMTALYALWRKDFNSTLSNIIFFTTALLVLLLAAELTLQIPGLVSVSLNAINLKPLTGERLEWSGICARSTRFPWPYRGGKLFVTDKRLIWATPKATGLVGAPRVEIYSKDLSAVIEGGEKRPPLLKRLLSTFIFAPGTHCIIVVSESGRKYSFLFGDEHTEVLRHLKKLLPAPVEVVQQESEATTAPAVNKGQNEASRQSGENSAKDKETPAS